MSSSSNITLTKGNILTSSSHAIINTVNCVGVMGKGIALAFKRKYPEMFKEYVRRCDQQRVLLGKPYPYFADDHIVVNFPTKQHWRSVSKLDDIEEGLIYLRRRLEDWGITSIAVPPLGCGNGQLDWSVVKPVLIRHLETFPVPVELYVPYDVDLVDDQFSLLESDMPANGKVEHAHKIDPGILALVEILRVIEEDSYHWPVGRVMFQKLAYFATTVGIPTSLRYVPGSYGPFADQLNKQVARLQNNGLVFERPSGKKIEVKVGPNYEESRAKIVESFDPQWRDKISRVADLMARFNTTQAEIAATVHYVARSLASRMGRAPYAADVVAGVEQWKIKRKPPLNHDDIGRSVVSLATQGWIHVVADNSVAKYIEEMESLF